MNAPARLKAGRFLCIGSVYSRHRSRFRNHLVLSAEDLAQIEDAVPASDVAGTRYDEHQMRILDSER